MVAETTALGAAYLAGLAVGYWSDEAEIADNWVLDREFEPQMSAERARRATTRGWKKAVERSRSLDWEDALRGPDPPPQRLDLLSPSAA